MNVRLHLRITALAFRSNVLRSVVAVSMVALGIAALIIMLALRAGAQAALEETAEQIGRNLFLVNAREVRALPNRSRSWYMSTKLKLPDAMAIRAEIGAVRAVVPMLEAGVRVRLDGQSVTTTVRGVTPEFLDVRNFRVGTGRAFDELDGAAYGRVALVGPFVADKLNGGRDMVGESIVIGSVPFLVIGQLAPKGLSADGANEDDQILIPLPTAARRLLNVDYLTRLLVQVDEASHMTAVRERVQQLLRDRHQLDAAADDDFEILDLVRVDAIKRMNSRFLTGASVVFAAITMIVGAASVLAVTYLNVRDRTAEIGLRRAVGARQRDIASLFIVEAALLSIAGGLVGVLIGSGSSAILVAATAWRVSIDMTVVATAFAAAASLGLLSGTLPAIKASRTTPVSALRSG